MKPTMGRHSRRCGNSVTIWLSSTPEGRKLIADYYVVAPRIVSAIPAGHRDWEWIVHQVEAARSAIAAGNNQAALKIYAGMVGVLQDRWL